MPSIFDLPPFTGDPQDDDLVHVGDNSDQLDKKIRYDDLVRVKKGSGANSIEQIDGGGAGATSSYALALGQGTEASGGNSVALGLNTIASASQAFAHGNASQAQGIHSWAAGVRAIARRYGEWARSAFRFAADGDAQIGTYHAANQTADAVPTPLFLDGTASTAGIDIADTSAIVVQAIVTARNTGANEAAGYRLSVLVRRDAGAGTTAVVGAQEKVVLGEDDAAWDANLVANTVFGAVGVLVTGAAGKTINWTARIDTSELTV